MVDLKWAQQRHGILIITTLIIAFACLCIHFPFFERKVSYISFTTLLVSTFVVLFYLVIAYTFDDAAGNVQFTEGAFLIIKGMCHLLFGCYLIYMMYSLNEILWNSLTLSVLMLVNAILFVIAGFLAVRTMLQNTARRRLEAHPEED